MLAGTVLVRKVSVAAELVEPVPGEVEVDHVLADVDDSSLPDRELDDDP